MRMFWRSGFAPAPWSGIDALFFIKSALKNALGFFLFWFVPEESRPVEAIVILLALGALSGAGWFWRQDRITAALFIGPVIAGAAASAFSLLPLEGRVSLWLGPPLLLLAGAGIASLSDWLPRRLAAVPMALAAILAVGALTIGIVIEPPPHRTQDLWPVLEQVAARALPGDQVYVYYGARQAVRFYGPRVGLHAWTEGRCHRRDTRAYFRELDLFRGRDRVWVIWTHAIPRFGEPEAIRSYLSAIGTERLRLDSPSGTRGDDGAQALLYDLSDPARLPLSSADRHTIPPPDFPDDGPNVPCGGPANDASVVR